MIKRSWPKMSLRYDPQRNPNKGNTKPSANKRRGIITAIVLGLVGVTAFMTWPSNISRQEAAEIAVAHVGGGNADRPEIDFERFRRVWSVEVFYGGLVHEVYVSRITGDVVGIEVDIWD